MARSISDRFRSFFSNDAGLVPAPPAESEKNEFGLPGEEYLRRMFSADNTRASDRLAAVYGCVGVISSTIAAMPLHLYRKRGGAREVQSDHPVAKLLSRVPNDAMTWPQFREAVNYNMVLRGNQHSRVFWKNGYPVEIFPLPQGCVETKLSDRRRVVYEIGQNDVKVEAGSFSKPDVAHFKALTGDGLVGINPIEHCRMTTGAAVALADYGRNSAQEGGPIRGILAMETAFKNAEQGRAARIRLNEGVQAARSQSGIALMEGAGAGTKFFPMTMTMRDAQYLESMKFSVIEICRIFNVPPHKIHDLERATFNNIEHMTLEFYTGCILPWLIRIEATLNECLLTQSDRDAGFFLRHNADGLLRGDLASRAEAQQKQILSETLTVNEARALEDRPPVKGGDEAFFPINHTTLEKIGKQPVSPVKPPTEKEDDDG